MPTVSSGTLAVAGVYPAQTVNLNTTGVTPGSYGSSIIIPTIIVDAYGRITNITNNSVNIMTTIIDTQTFTSNGTWTKPANAKYLNVLLIGGGGGGGSGRKGAVSSLRGAGIGGAAGTTIHAYNVPISLFPNATYGVTVGIGGTGGVGQSVNSTDGNTGANGSLSTFHILRAPGGVGGLGGFSWGSNSIRDSGSYLNTDDTPILATDLDYKNNIVPSVTNNINRAQSNAMESSTLTYTSVPTTTVCVSMTYFITSVRCNQFCAVRVLAATNGSPGSYLSSSNAYNAPPFQPGILVSGVPFTAPPVAPSTNGIGPDGVTFNNYYGIGGCGSAWETGGTAYNAGNGGNYGGGGGGSAGTTDSTANSGAGGNGANGIVVVWTYG